MTPLSSPLSQYWQTVVERLPEGFTETSLSVQAKSVLTFSDFALDSVIAHPEWLAELESASPQLMNGDIMLAGYRRRWQVSVTTPR